MILSDNSFFCRTIHELSDLIRQCELTTIACTATLLKGIANLWAPVPQELERLADVARTSQPGQEFMSFLQQQQNSNSLLTSNVSTTSNGQWWVWPSLKSFFTLSLSLPLTSPYHFLSYNL
ncbi:unnamed protein product [Meloidogyne enterolobii]|uniref:Uncharacterized protein n=1 Tax=Meloidogyne enterolobii TaxID=390850 RepID=A0ACB0YYQ4_MELEN